MKPSASMACAAIDNPGRDMHFIACIARGARHRQAMSEKIPILGHHIEQPGRSSLHGQRDFMTCRSLVC